MKVTQGNVCGICLGEKGYTLERFYPSIRIMGIDVCDGCRIIITESINSGATPLHLYIAHAMRRAVVEHRRVVALGLAEPITVRT